MIYMVQACYIHFTDLYIIYILYLTYKYCYHVMKSPAVENMYGEMSEPF